MKRSLHNLSVGKNGLLIPAALIEDHLAQYCTSLGVWTGDAFYPVYIPGSASLLKYKSRYFMICTRHQINGTPDLESVCLLIPEANGTTRCVSSGGARWFEKVGDGDHQQVVVFDFTEPCNSLPELKPMFFDFRQQHPTLPAHRIAAFITYGYLTTHTNIDYANGQLALVKTRFPSRFAPPGADNALHVIEPISPLDFDPDGMSGGPTFCFVQESPNKVTVHFAGVTVRGGREKIMLIKAGAVQSVLETFIRDRPLKTTRHSD